jgi:hypothetical protein
MRWQINLICAAVGPRLRRNLSEQNGGSVGDMTPTIRD